jgi:hypothetical protein
MPDRISRTRAGDYLFGHRIVNDMECAISDSEIPKLLRGGVGNGNDCIDQIHDGDIGGCLLRGFVCSPALHGHDDRGEAWSGAGNQADEGRNAGLGVNNGGPAVGEMFADPLGNGRAARQVPTKGAVHFMERDLGLLELLTINGIGFVPRAGVAVGENQNLMTLALLGEGQFGQDSAGAALKKGREMNDAISHGLEKEIRREIAFGFEAKHFKAWNDFSCVDRGNDNVGMVILNLLQMFGWKNRNACDRLPVFG